MVENGFCEYCSKPKNSPSFAYHICVKPLEKENSINREIKFRLRIGKEIVGYEKWCVGDGSDSKWIYCKNFEGKYPDNVWRSEPIYHTTKDQFTGFLDKNKKEIYEGDILATELVLNVTVFWSPQYGQWRGKYHKENIYLPECEINDSVTYTSKIIGNIFENPELLET